MKNASIVELFKEHQLFEKSIVLERYQYLKVGGSIDTNIYYIENGSLKIFLLDETEERIVRFGYKNNLIVSIDSFLNNKPSELYIQALKKTEIQVITKKKFSEFINSSNERMKLWLTILEDLVLQQIEREKDLLISSPKERYERVLKRSPQLFQEIPNKHIANYLRMSAETLSRLKNS